MVDAKYLNALRGWARSIKRPVAKWVLPAFPYTFEVESVRMRLAKLTRLRGIFDYCNRILGYCSLTLAVNGVYLQYNQQQFSNLESQMLTGMKLAAELINRNALQDAQAAAPAALAAEQAAQTSIVKAPAELIAAEVAAAKELQDRQAAAEQARLDALCISEVN